MPIDDLVRIRNTGDQPFRHRYLHHELVLPAGSETMIQREVMIYLMGNPELRDIDHRRRYRTLEVKRVRALYGSYYDDEAWERNKPPLEAFTPDGERIYTIIEDPEGKIGLPETAMLDQQTLMQRQIDSLQQQLRDIQNANQVQARAEQAEQYEAPVDSDPSKSSVPPATLPPPADNPLIPTGDQDTVLPSPRLEQRVQIDPGDLPEDVPRRIEVS